MKVMDALEARGLDSELAARMGLAAIPRDGGEALVIPFLRDGEIVRRKYRSLGPEKKFWADKGGVRCCWNEDALRDDKLLAQPLIITEGELDALAVIQAGYPRTISVPDGAPQEAMDNPEDAKAYAWLADIRPYLTKERVSEIILAVDGDGPGAALMQDLSVLLGRFRCKFVTYPKARDPNARGRERLKDLNEVLQDYGAKGVVETVNRAQWLRVDGVYRMSDLPPLPPMQIFDIGFNLLSDNYKLRLGDFVVITGTPGFGKSTFVNDLCCRVAMTHKLNIAWASFEQSPQRDHRRSLRTWFNEYPEWKQTPGQLAQADAWIDERHLFIVPGDDDDVTLDWLLDRMEVAATQHGTRVFVIDPWNELDHSKQRDESETEYIGRAIRALKRFAKSMQVHIIVVAHPTKSVKDAEGNYKMPTLYDINGSANWYNKADIGIIVHRETEMDTIIKVQKSRYHEIIGRPGEVRMHYCADDRRYRETERAA
jgi:twinkle protein